jgi:hypothetical protein
VDTVILSLSELQITGSVVRGVVRDLIPGTTYTVMVAGVNGATTDDGLGMMSSPVQADTLIGEDFPM